MKARYIDWVSNLSWDWCISRQRFFGIPFPVWHCADCKHVILAEIKDLPIDPQEVAAPTTCPECNGNNITPDTDVMDTWNTSSITPYICQNVLEKNFEKQKQMISHENNEKIVKNTKVAMPPMALRPQAHDIIRTWAFYTIVKSWMHDEKIPWHDIVISGHVLGRENKKLSKKEGTDLIPEKLLQEYPADAIRYWTASGRLGQDIQFSPEQLKIGIRLINKLWNAFRFCQPHIEGIMPEAQLSEKDFVSQWLLHKISDTFNQYEQYLEKYEFSLALQVIEEFFWKNFCDNYIELIKNRLFNPQDYDPSLIHSTQWTLYHVGLRILQLFAPFVPFVTETLFEQLYTQSDIESLHTSKLSDVQQQFVFEHAVQDIDIIITIVGIVRRLKTEQQVSLKTTISHLTITLTNTTLIDRVKAHEQLLRGVTQAETISILTTDTDKTELTQNGDQWLAQVHVK